jgi:hypothetical protein
MLGLFLLGCVAGFDPDACTFGQKQGASQALQNYQDQSHAELNPVPVAVDPKDCIRESRCRDLHKTHHVTVGSSWGSLTAELQQEWMKIRCDPFFCKPDPKEGKGIYKCTPL